MFMAKLDTFGYRVSFGNGHVCIYCGNDLVGHGHLVDGLYRLLLHDSHMPDLCFPVFILQCCGVGNWGRWTKIFCEPYWCFSLICIP